MLYLEDDVKIVQGFLEKGKSGLTLVMDFLHPFSFQEHLKTIMDSRHATGPEHLIAAAGRKDFRTWEVSHVRDE